MRFRLLQLARQLADSDRCAQTDLGVENLPWRKPARTSLRACLPGSRYDAIHAA